MRKSINPQLLFLFIINVVVAQNQSLNSSFLSLFADSLGASPSETGKIVFLSGIVASAIMVPSGVLSHILGKKTMIGASIALSTVSALSYTLAANWQHLILPATLLSASFALFITARMTLIADLSSPKNRATVYSLMNISWPAGSIYGPVVGGFLADIFQGWKAPFYFMALTSALSIIPALYIKEDRKSLENSAGKSGFREKIGLLTPVIPLYLAHLLMEFGIMAVDPFIPLYLDRRFSVTKTRVGLFYSLGFGLATLLPQMFAGYVADKYGRKIVMLYCVLAMSPAYLLCAIADSYTKLMILYMGINALWSMTWPASMALLIDATPMLTRDISVSMRQTCIRLGATVGPLVGGFIWELGGETRIFYVGAAFMAAAVTTILVQKEIKD